MLHAINPFTAILATVRVGVGSRAMLFVELVAALVFAAILPNVVSITMHHSILEATLEVATIGPLETPITAHLIVLPTSCVLWAISPEVDTFSFFDAIPENTMVVAAIGPDLNSLSILFILRRNLWSWLNRVKVILDVKANILTEDAQTSLAVLLPKSFIDIVRQVDWRAEDTQATGLPIDPVSFEGASIGPDHLAIATLGVFVAGNRIVTLLWADLSLSIERATSLTTAVNWHHAHLAHVLEGAKFHRFER